MYISFNEQSAALSDMGSTQLRSNLNRGRKPSLGATLLGEERPRDMFILIFILVLLLHVWGILWQRFNQDEVVTEAKP
ncbi:hypothetical protein [Methylomonas sp. AM2-LC]|uniref:hypothetical protein n=1 Tax=Methylomonas sp. AM2-LC TaxID=3153301 RepID=UPI003263690D